MFEDFLEVRAEIYLFTTYVLLRTSCILLTTVDTILKGKIFHQKVNQNCYLITELLLDAVGTF